jgi:hypothetical protein
MTCRSAGLCGSARGRACSGCGVLAVMPNVNVWRLLCGGARSRRRCGVVFGSRDDGFVGRGVWAAPTAMGRDVNGGVFLSDTSGSSSPPVAGMGDDPGLIDAKFPLRFDIEGTCVVELVVVWSPLLGRWTIGSLIIRLDSGVDLHFLPAFLSNLGSMLESAFSGFVDSLPLAIGQTPEREV